jgi:hypothetical protein
MDKTSFELRPHDQLKDQLLKVIKKQTEKDYINIKKSLKIEKKRLERLSSQQQLSRQQIEFYTQEYQLALDNMKKSSSKITKEICEEFKTLEKPSEIVEEIVCKVMLVFGQPSKFSDFLNLSENYSEFKDLLNTTANSVLPDTVINEILPIWKNQAFFQAKVARCSKLASLLAEWLSFTVEFSLKKSTVLTSKRKDPELQKKLRIQTDILKDLGKDLQFLKEKMKNLQKTLKDLETDELSRTFKSISNNDRKSFSSTSHRRSLSQVFGSLNLQNFPNFNDDELYGEMPEQTSSEEKLIIEGNESIGCCRMRFFCF